MFNYSILDFTDAVTESLNSALHPVCEDNKMSIFADHLQTYDSPQSASLLCLAMVLCTQYTTTDLTPIPVEHRILQDVLQMHPSVRYRLCLAPDVT